jgi:hypothetical protein
VASISDLKDWLSRKSQPDLPSVTVSALGFTVGEVFVTWQTVSEIWGYKADRLTTDEAFLEFTAGGLSLPISEEQPGFLELEAAMISAFPTTATWRQTVLQPAFARSRTLLYRRA